MKVTTAIQRALSNARVYGGTWWVQVNEATKHIIITQTESIEGYGEVYEAYHHEKAGSGTNVHIHTGEGQ